MCRALLLLPAVSPSQVGCHSFPQLGKTGTAPAVLCQQKCPQGVGQHCQPAGTGVVARTTEIAQVCSIEQLKFILPGSFSLMS